MMRVQPCDVLRPLSALPFKTSTRLYARSVFRAGLSPMAAAGIAVPAGTLQTVNFYATFTESTQNAKRAGFSKSL